MAGTIFLSGSRGGMIAFVAQMALLTLIARVQKNRRAALAASLVIISIAALILWIGGQELTTRITSIHSEAKTELDTGVRMRIDRDGLRMFSERPVLGWGLGNFPVVYPQFRSFFTDKFVNRAHNDYLQLLTETGLAGFGTIVWFLILVYRRAIKKLENWHADMNGAVALAMLLSCTGILVHSFLDSNLQIPANAALFYCMCTLAAAGTNFGSHRRPRARTHGDS
jgi:O-antigen ligase